MDEMDDIVDGYWLMVDGDYMDEIDEMDAENAE